LIQVLEVVSSLLDTPKEVIAMQTLRNAYALFGLDYSEDATMFLTTKGKEISKEDALLKIMQRKCVVMGQVQSKFVVELQTEILQGFLEGKEGRIHSILECFSFEMQYLLDDFMK
jgi:uncharacterized iron-regulated protein